MTINNKINKIYIGADHRGFKLKEKVKEWLEDWEYEFQDEGAHELDRNDDYTTYASKVAEKVADREDARGILICGSGVGVDVTANKFDGVRASIGKDKRQVRAGRKDDDMNVLVLAADFTSKLSAKWMVKEFLETEYQKSLKHERRLRDIKKIEENN